LQSTAEPRTDAMMSAECVPRLAAVESDVSTTPCPVQMMPAQKPAMGDASKKATTLPERQLSVKSR
jgi:hypothetical protein